MKKDFKVKDIGNWKFFRSKEYNYNFNKKTGLFQRWGKEESDDPNRSIFGPEIWDVEITTICNNSKNCSYCYKGNTSKGKNMSLGTFKNLLNKINGNKQLTQLAFGLGATGTENPDIWEMCKYARSQGVIPNGTVANITPETADLIANNFGACAVSIHGDKNICYDSVKLLTDRGLKQTNIHHVIYEENFQETIQIIQDIMVDPRLKDLNAIVFLSLKHQGRAKNNSNFTSLSQEKFSKIMKYAMAVGINFGMDSCGASKYLKVLDQMKTKFHFLEHNYTTVEQTKEFFRKAEESCEPCEATMFSSYTDVDGIYEPCSFCSKSNNWPTGISVLETEDFIKDIWNGERCSIWRDKLIANNRSCFEYEV